jgi:hypothetical protein
MTVYKLLPEGIYELQSTTFEREGILEKISIQKVLRSNIDVVAPDVFIIAEEFGSWEESRRRIDLLGVDKEGNLVSCLVASNEVQLFLDTFLGDKGQYQQNLCQR